MMLLGGDWPHGLNPTCDLHVQVWPNEVPTVFFFPLGHALVQCVRRLGRIVGIGLLLTANQIAQPFYQIVTRNSLELTR